MPFIAHTEADIAAMLATIGASSTADLFIEIPTDLKVTEISGIGARMTEMQVAQMLQQRAQQDHTVLNFIGAGCYEHYIPAAVWELCSRGEFMTAYTPYQAEASQGTLQLLYEYQTMLANLTGLEVSNASLYDGATALAEAVLMAVRCSKHADNKKILLPLSVHPFYRQVVKTISGAQGIELIDIDFDLSSGKIATENLHQYSKDNFVALVIPQPNFFGVLEDVDELTDWAHNQDALVIATVNPLSLGLLKPPGAWGTNGVDIACGEAQSLGVPLASGGPYIGFMCCKKIWIRQLPGRLVGMTTDTDGKRGFTLTLQAREQHIRRAKATSNICTNQGLLATAVTIYLSLMGAVGLKQVALQSHINATKFKYAVLKIAEIKIVFSSPFFHEIVLSFDKPVAEILDKLAQQGIQGGFDVSQYYPKLGNAMLCCVTETKTDADIDSFIQALTAC
jgi:glycine dehydrogenase subunit 1